MFKGDQKAMVSVHLIAAWKEAIARGLADQFCNRIVLERDPPDRLIKDIYKPQIWKKREHILSRRERQCLSLLSFGFPREEVATYLGISENTLKTHIKHIKLKLNTHTEAESVAVAFRLKEII